MKTHQFTQVHHLQVPNLILLQILFRIFEIVNHQLVEIDLGELLFCKWRNTS